MAASSSEFTPGSVADDRVFLLFTMRSSDAIRLVISINALLDSATRARIVKTEAIPTASNLSAISVDDPTIH